MIAENKVALITGAGRGIGRAIALELADRGIDIAVHYNESRKEAAETVKQVEQLGVKACALQGDISRVADVEALFQSVDECFGRLDILVNNAGVVKPSPLESLSGEVFDQIFAVNVKGSAFAAREAAKRLALGGRIVNITSSRAHFAAAGTTCYAGSKAALECLTRIWAVELGAKGITVNAIAPGPTTPGMFDRAPDFLQSAALQSSPFARIGTANEIASVVAFLCSESASWVTGQVVLVNGGGTI